MLNIVLWANDGNWTHDLFLTKETLYPWATSANSWAKKGTRTLDPDLGKVVLYQLSYFRECINLIASAKIEFFFIVKRVL